MIYDVLVVGGGASGLAAAIMAAREGASRVAVLEKQPRVGRKLLSTGNGRCNITNTGARAQDYAGAPGFVAPVMREFPPARVVEFFSSIGLMLRQGDEGRVYPMSNQASAVLDCLRLELDALGVIAITGFSARSVRCVRGAYEIIGEDERVFRGKRVIVCAGGRAAPQLGGCADYEKLLAPLGHAFTRCLPALTPLKTDKAQIAGLKGARHIGEVALIIDGREASTESGEILFTDYGVSGIAVMQLSGAAARALDDGASVEISINVLGMPKDAALELLNARAKALNARPAQDFLTGTANKLVVRQALRASGIQAQGETPRDMRVMARALCDWRLRVSATAGYEHAQVMQGGADMSDFDSRTLMSKRAQGVFAAGELLDVSGPCGGYNLQWAWASGLLAGRSAARSLKSSVGGEI